jgi:hypothetical protein
MNAKWTYFLSINKPLCTTTALLNFATNPSKRKDHVCISGDPGKGPSGRSMFPLRELFRGVNNRL